MRFTLLYVILNLALMMGFVSCNKIEKKPAQTSSGQVLPNKTELISQYGAPIEVKNSMDAKGAKLYRFKDNINAQLRGDIVEAVFTDPDVSKNEEKLNYWLHKFKTDRTTTSKVEGIENTHGSTAVLLKSETQKIGIIYSERTKTVVRIIRYAK